MMNKLMAVMLLLCASLEGKTQGNQIVAGEHGGATYVDFQPDKVVVCFPTPPSEGCGPVYDSLDLNADGIVDYRLQAYRAGLNGVSYSIHRIFPMGNNQVLTDTFNYTTPFSGAVADGRVAPLDSGLVLSDAGIYQNDSVIVFYTDSLGFAADSMHHFQRHFVFRDTSGLMNPSFFFDIPTVGFLQSMWNGTNPGYAFAGLRFFAGTDTMYAWMRVSGNFPSTYMDYAFTGQLVDVPELENSEEAECKIFPNPASEVLNISIKDRSAKQWSVCITDCTGRAVLNAMMTKDQAAIVVSELPEGVYFLRLKSEERSVTRKLIVLHRDAAQ